MSIDVAGRGTLILQSNPINLKTNSMMVHTVALVSQKIFLKIIAKPFLTSLASKKNTSLPYFNAKKYLKNSLLSLYNN
jgi:hypothetical protein